MTAPPGPGGPTDAALVARVLEADREAFAVVYDRYGPRLYDFAYSMLRHPEDAADAVADSFVLFAERLAQLRDPERLRPWLYAIVRSECLRRLKARKRVSYGDDEQLMAMADDAATPEEAAERAALTKLVWDAAAGLADRDRALLDLHLRQGFEGAELGEAMGVSASNAYVMLNRLRGQVDRSLGALLIARLGREDCAELDAVLADWDGTFSPLIRKRVARHVDSCSVCGDRRTRILSPWALLAAVPVFVAPAALRDRVLEDTRLVAYAGPPVSTSRPAGRRSARTRAAIAATAALLVGTAATVALWPRAEDPPTASASATSPGAPLASEAPGSTLAPTSTSAPSNTPTASSTGSPSALPGSLTVSTATVDLGTSASRGGFTIANTGELGLAYTATPSTAWLRVSPSTGDLEGGASRSMTVRADRSRAPEGRSTARVVLRWAGGSRTVTISLTEDRAPLVGVPSASQPPSCGSPTVTVRVRVSDPSGLSSVRLRWSGPHGTGESAMTRSGSQWTAPMGPFTLGGTVTFHVVARDRAGNTTTGPTATVDATPCPG